jgi:hypothetical protein
MEVFYLLLGLLPYRLEWKKSAEGNRVLIIKALFWALRRVQSKGGRSEWCFFFPFLKKHFG